MNCPVCTVGLVMTDRQGIEIDYCPKCRGIWLDRGELDKLIERAMQGGVAPQAVRDNGIRGGNVPPVPPVPPHYADPQAYRRRDDDDDDDDRKYSDGRRRKKGWLGDLLDFD